MRLTYKKIRKQIPAMIKIGKNKRFKVEWVDDCGKGDNGRPLYGITTFNPNVIKLRKDQSDEMAVLSFFHEFLHTTDHYKKGQNLHENQVLKLESRFEFFYYFFLLLITEDDLIKRLDTLKKG